MGQKANVDECHYCREIVGLSRWQFPHTLSAEQTAEKDKFDNTPLPKPEGWNKELEKEFFDALEERYEQWVDDSKDYCVSRFPLPMTSSHSVSPYALTIDHHEQPVTLNYHYRSPRSLSSTYPSTAGSGHHASS